MQKTSAEFDEEVAEIVSKLEDLPLFRRRDASAVSLALGILSARYAMQDGGEKEDFVETATSAWELEEERG